VQLAAHRETFSRVEAILPVHARQKVTARGPTFGSESGDEW
jgi:hypothetical protein